MAMTYRPSKEANKAIEQIKKDVDDITTTSKAIEYVLAQFPVLRKELDDVYADLDNSENELKNIKMTLHTYTKAKQDYNNMINKMVSK